QHILRPKLMFQNGRRDFEGDVDGCRFPAETARSGSAAEAATIAEGSTPLSGRSRPAISNGVCGSWKPTTSTSRTQQPASTAPARGEVLSLLEKGWGAPSPDQANQRGPVWRPASTKEHPDGEDTGIRADTRE